MTSKVGKWLASVFVGVLVIVVMGGGFAVDAASSSSSAVTETGSSSSVTGPVGPPAPYIVSWPKEVSDGVCAVLVAISLVPSCILIALHLVCYVQPLVQRFIVRLILIVPVFGVFGYFSFLFVKAGLWLAIFKDLYEAYSLYVFYCLLVSWCGDVKCLTSCLANKIPPKTKVLPCIKITTPPMRNLVMAVRITILQFLVIKPLLTFIAAVLESQEKLGKVQLAFRIIDILSFVAAMMALLLFYRAISPCLEGLNAMGIFLWLKGFLLLVVVQEFIVNLLVQFRFIHPWDGLDPPNRGERLNDFLIFLELILFSFAAFFVFTPLPFFNRKKLGEYDDKLVKGKTTGQLVLFGLWDALVKLWDTKGKGCWHGTNMATVSFQAGTGSGTTNPYSPPTFIPVAAPDMVGSVQRS
ncbi:transmembrane protein 184C [Pelomyxa schiedti]|nr:transmembrane protein 184C [Pelomyxa schiedti]